MKTLLSCICALLLALGSGTACAQEHHGPGDFGTDLARNNFLYWFLFFGVYREYIPCNLPEVRYFSPGDSVVLNLSPGGATSPALYAIGCSATAWSFTVTPSAGVDTFIQRVSCSGDFSGVTVADSGVAGVPESISGPAGCSVGNNAAHRFRAKSGPGTLTVQFN